MKIDIIGSIIATLVLVAIIDGFRLDFYATVILIIGACIILNNWGYIKCWCYHIKDKFKCKCKCKKCDYF